MKLGILSDTHDQLARCEQAVALLQAAGVEALIHCGDITEPKVIAACAALPLSFVFGNNDFRRIPELHAAAKVYEATCLDFGGIIPFAGKTIAVTHGHLTAEVRRLLSVEPNYLLCGHTHAREDRHHGSTRVINPGALHRARVFTVATLDLATDTLEFVTVPR